MYPILGHSSQNIIKKLWAAVRKPLTDFSVRLRAKGLSEKDDKIFGSLNLIQRLGIGSSRS